MFDSLKPKKAQTFHTVKGDTLPGKDMSIVQTPDKTLFIRDDMGAQETKKIPPADTRATSIALEQFKANQNTGVVSMVRSVRVNLQIATMNNEIYPEVATTLFKEFMACAALCEQVMPK